MRFLSFAVLALLLGCSPQEPEITDGIDRANPATVLNEVEFVDDALIINGKRIELPSDINDVIEVLGAPSRKSPFLEGMIYRWDDSGVLILVPDAKYSNKFPRFNITLRTRPRPNPSQPKVSYKGKIKTPLGTVTGDTTPDELVKMGFKLIDGVRPWYQHRYGADTKINFYVRGGQVYEAGIWIGIQH